MLRRNGKPVSCEPCRVAKVRCDHSIPICRRCKSKGITEQCYYHPAPLTRPKTQNDDITPVSVGKLKVKHPTRARKQVGGISPRSLIDGRRRDASSAEAVTKISPQSNYLGTTSYLSVFGEASSWVPRASLNRSLQADFEYWRTNHTYTCTRLVRLLCAVQFLRKHIAWYYARGRFTTIPAPLVLDSLYLVQKQMEQLGPNQQSNWEEIYKQISAATSLPLEFTRDTTAEEFYSSFTGVNLRWEYVGYIFALAGSSIRRRFKGTHVLDLGDGEIMDADTFLKEMVLASNACIEICRQYAHVNDLMLWMYHAHLLLGSNVLGETNERLYGLFGDLVSKIYAMGLHRGHHSTHVPFFLSETRKRVLANIHKSDKLNSTLTGRPPRLPYQYCDFTLPLDLPDDQLFLDEKSIEIALEGLDDEGWNSQGQFYPATVIRMRHILSTLREKTLELSLGDKTKTYRKDLLETYKSCQRTWDQIPVRFRYSPNCWEDRETSECLARTTVFLEYLSSVFQIHRIRRQENPEATKDLLDSSMQLLSVIIDLMKQWHRPEIRGQLEWLFLVCGIPAAGVLVTEVRRYTIANHPLPSSSPRSEIIRNLSFITSWFQDAAPSSLTGTVCMELTKMISRLLDEALDYQLPFPSLMESGDIQDVNNNTGAATVTSAPAQVAEEMNLSESQQQLQGLMEGGPMDSLWFELGTEYGVGDDAFHTMSHSLVSDGLNWLDGLGLDTDLDVNGGATET